MPEIESGDELSLSEALYEGECGKCGSSLVQKGFDGDPDGPTWRMKCGNPDCEQRYLLSASKVAVI